MDRRTRYLTPRGDNSGKIPEKAWGKYLLTGGMLICPTFGGHFGLNCPKEVRRLLNAETKGRRLHEHGGIPDRAD